MQGEIDARWVWWATNVIIHSMIFVVFTLNSIRLVYFAKTHSPAKATEYTK